MRTKKTGFVFRRLWFVMKFQRIYIKKFWVSFFVIQINCSIKIYWFFFNGFYIEFFFFLMYTIACFQFTSSEKRNCLKLTKHLKLMKHSKLMKQSVATVVNYKMPLILIHLMTEELPFLCRLTLLSIVHTCTIES